MFYKQVLKYIPLTFLFVSISTYAQESTTTMDVNINLLDNATSLNLNEKIAFEDSIFIQLTSFSHKRPYTGGPTKATAYLTLFKNSKEYTIMLSVHGQDGKTEERFDSIRWEEYTLTLIQFEYEKSIRIILSK